jgi:hypothetical protein
MTINWTAEMLAELRAMRARGVPLYRCAERVGVHYSSAVYKARELGIAQRCNRGRKPGEQVFAEELARQCRAENAWAELRRVLDCELREKADDDG